MIDREIIFKVYDKTGTLFLGQLEQKKVLSDLSFSSEINGGQGQLGIKYSVPFDDVPDIISISNLIKVYEVSNNDGVQSQRLLYSGFISQYTPVLTSISQYVEITCLSLASMLTLAFFKDGVSYSPSYTNEKISDIFKDVVDHFNSVHGSILSYDSGSIPDTTAILTYTFTRQKHLEVLKKAFESMQDTHFWRVDPDGKVYLQEQPNSPTYFLTLGKEVVEARGAKSGEELINGFLLVGDGTVGEVYKEDATSKIAYGVRESFLEDGEYSSISQAESRALAEIEANKNIKNTPKIKVANFDFGKINVGESCRLQNYKKDSNIFGENMIIVQKDYKMQSATLHLGTQKENFKKAWLLI